LFANAVFQWVPDHPAVLRRLLEALPEGGALAVQMPDNTNEPALALMREVAGKGPWAQSLALAAAARDDLPTVADYYDLLRPVCTHLDIWHTVYNHVMGPQGIVEWFKGRRCSRSCRRSMTTCAQDLLPTMPPASQAYPARFVAKYY
jgi:trans-aconitate 2-methyltransferase